MTLSIITVHLNDFINLEQTFHSIRSVNWETPPQWIVIDGGSRPIDRKEALIWEQVVEFVDNFVSEPDKGIYDAMNKGTCIATGQFVLYLNAGDVFHPDFCSSQLDRALNCSQYGMIWGQCEERYENGSLVKVKTRSEKAAWYGMPACHQAMLFRRELLPGSPYLLKYSLASDYELVCRLLDEGVQVLRLNRPLCIYRRGGVSDQSLDLVRDEYRKIQDRYFSTPVPIRMGVSLFKSVNHRLAKVAWLRNAWRRWI